MHDRPQSCRTSRPGVAPLALLALLAGCGDLPQPYRGRPGGQAAVLAIPLAIRLAVPPPEQALLGNAQARQFAAALVAALQSEDVPVIASDAPLPLDWLVEITAERQGPGEGRGRREAVRPRFRLLDADRKPQATTEGNPVPLEDWANADRALFDRVARENGPKLTQLLLQVEAARKSTDPAALAAGPPRLYMVGVQGAPGDGNTSLAARMKEQLGSQGFVVQDSAEGAAYGLQADVAVVPGATRAVQRVEIIWIVSRRDGQELGRVVQMNEIPNGRLNRLWGDIAYVAANEAADGVKTVVANAQQAPATAADAPKPTGPAVGAVPPPPPSAALTPPPDLPPLR